MISLQMKVFLTLGGPQNKLFNPMSFLWVFAYCHVLSQALI